MTEMTTILLVLLSYFAVPAVLIFWTSRIQSERRWVQHFCVGALNFSLAWLRPAEKIGAVTLFVFCFWVLTAVGVWEPPTPANLEKLDRDLAEQTQ